METWHFVANRSMLSLHQEKEQQCKWIAFCVALLSDSVAFYWPHTNNRWFSNSVLKIFSKKINTTKLIIYIACIYVVSRCFPASYIHGFLQVIMSTGSVFAL